MEIFFGSVFIIFMVFCSGGYLGYKLAYSELVKDTVKGEGGVIYAKFKKGFETYYFKIEKKSHLSVHIEKKDIQDWNK